MISHNTDGKYVESKHRGLLCRFWGNGHQGGVFMDNQRNIYQANISYTFSHPTLRPSPKDRKPCIPRGLPGSDKRRLFTHEILIEAPTIPDVGPARGVALRGQSSAVFGLVAQASCFHGRLEARVAYIPVRHLKNADLPCSKTKVSILRYQCSNKA